ncbi:MAG: hypothetical protein LBM70_00810, partial [Victivallales bacterium]|nr:hypothetical protein [Victivallales bacterium]
MTQFFHDNQVETWEFIEIMSDDQNKDMLIHADHLVKSYHGRKVVDDVSISVKSGEVVGLLG